MRRALLCLLIADRKVLFVAVEAEVALSVVVVEVDEKERGTYGKVLSTRNVLRTAPTE